MTATAISWTPTRREGLARLAAATPDGHRIGLRSSNNNDRDNLYWQTADWLCQQHLARTFTADTTRIVITDAGRDVVRAWERSS